MVSSIAKFKVDRDEVLRYLGHKGQDINDEMNILIDESRKEILKICRPRYTYQFFDIEKDRNKVKVVNTTLDLEGNSILENLRDSDSVGILAVTLGNELDKKLALEEKS